MHYYIIIYFDFKNNRVYIVDIDIPTLVPTIYLY